CSRFCVCVFFLQEVQGLLAVFYKLQFDRPVLHAFQGISDEGRVDAIIFYNEDPYGEVAVRVHCWPSAGTAVKKNVAPAPGRPSAQMRPPYSDTIREQIARPIPLPAYLLRACSRLKTPNILCA